MNESYFNTTNLEGEELQKAEKKALTQEEKILAFFKSHPGVGFAPHAVQSGLNMQNTPPTSIRRAITCLTRKGHLTKTDQLIDGLYGKPVHVWVYAGEGAQCG